jgi:outer membrane protein assembly factor BamD
VKYFIYILIAFTAASCSNYQKLMKEGTAPEKLEAAKKYYKDKDYIRSIPLFEELMGLYYGKPEREEIFYLLAYSHYGNGEYRLAGFRFNNFAQSYALSPKKEEASYMGAVCKYKQSMPHELDQTPTKAAINSLQAFINQYPNSVYVSDCNSKIDDLRSNVLKKVYESAKLYHSLGYYKSAIVSCTNALDDYPDMINRLELSFLIVDAAYQYANNSITKKQVERYTDTLSKIKIFKKEFGSKSQFAKEITKIEEKSSAQLALLQ